MLILTKTINGWEAMENNYLILIQLKMTHLRLNCNVIKGSNQFIGPTIKL